MINEIRECGRRVFKAKPKIRRLFKSPWGPYRQRGSSSTEEGDQPDASDGSSDEDRTDDE